MWIYDRHAVLGEGSLCFCFAEAWTGEKARAAKSHTGGGRRRGRVAACPRVRISHASFVQIAAAVRKCLARSSSTAATRRRHDTAPCT